MHADSQIGKTSGVSRLRIHHIKLQRANMTLGGEVRLTEYEPQTVHKTVHKNLKNMVNMVDMAWWSCYKITYHYCRLLI